MKKVLLGSTLAGMLMLAGCAGGPYAGGALFSQTQLPVTATEAADACTKSGEASMINILGIVAIGDASIEAAKKNAGVTTVSTVDTDFFNILGLFAKSTTKVCGK